MTAIDETALGSLDKQGRLLNAVLKGDTTKPGRFGFRGDIALKWQAQLADEKRPPDYSLEQVLTVAQAGETTIPVLAGYLHDYAWLKDLAEVLKGALAPDGVYFVFCNNLDLLSKYRTKIGDIAFRVLPCDESTVWKEMMDLAGLDKNDMKKLDAAGKLDKLLDTAAKLDDSYEEAPYETVMSRVGPVKNRNENRPV